MQFKALNFNKICVPALMLGDLTFVLGLKRNFDSLEYKQVSKKIEPNLEKVCLFYWSMHIFTLPKKKRYSRQISQVSVFSIPNTNVIQIQTNAKQCKKNKKCKQDWSWFAVKANLIFVILTAKNWEACKLHIQKCIYLPKPTISIFSCKKILTT